MWSGWISAFMFWDQKGKKIERSKRAGTMLGPLMLDGVVYDPVAKEDMPPGFSTV